MTKKLLLFALLSLIPCQANNPQKSEDKKKKQKLVTKLSSITCQTSNPQKPEEHFKKTVEFQDVLNFIKKYHEENKPTLKVFGAGFGTGIMLKTFLKHPVITPLFLIPAFYGWKNRSEIIKKQPVWQKKLNNYIKQLQEKYTRAPHTNPEEKK